MMLLMQDSLPSRRANEKNPERSRIPGPVVPEGQFRKGDHQKKLLITSTT
jgi:hypothetical protein